MSDYFKLFDTHDDYEDFVEDDNMVTPNVALCAEENDVHYNDRNWEEEYLTFEIIQDGTVVWKTTAYTQFARTISYSLDDGETWTSITSTTSGVSINVKKGQYILFKGSNNGYCNTNNVGAYSFFGGTAQFNACGNIMSLIYGDNFQNQFALISSRCFRCLFYQSNVVNCNKLVLPATTLTTHCYAFMFDRCSVLTTPPPLPSMTLAENCYQSMFHNCINLSTPPPLPSMTLAENCYSSMFSGCVNLVSAPELPATTLTTHCYDSMFYGCTRLNFIKANFLNINENSQTINWTVGVAQSGNFIKNINATQRFPYGPSGIPYGWTCNGKVGGRVLTTENRYIVVDCFNNYSVSTYLNNYNRSRNVFQYAGSIDTAERTKGYLWEIVSNDAQAWYTLNQGNCDYILTTKKEFTNDEMLLYTEDLSESYEDIEILNNDGTFYDQRAIGGQFHLIEYWKERGIEYDNTLNRYHMVVDDFKGEPWDGNETKEDYLDAYFNKDIPDMNDNTYTCIGTIELDNDTYYIWENDNNDSFYLLTEDYELDYTETVKYDYDNENCVVVGYLYDDLTIQYGFDSNELDSENFLFFDYWVDD